MARGALVALGAPCEYPYTYWSESAAPRRRSHPAPDLSSWPRWRTPVQRVPRIGPEAEVKNRSPHDSGRLSLRLMRLAARLSGAMRSALFQSIRASLLR